MRDSDGDTPLFVAEDIPTAMLLLQLGADPKHTNDAGETVRVVRGPWQQHTR